MNRRTFVRRMLRLDNVAKQRNGKYRSADAESYQAALLFALAVRRSLKASHIKPDQANNHQQNLALRKVMKRRKRER
jgi:transposase